MRSRSTSVINGASYPSPTAADLSAQPPGYGSLLELAARLAVAPDAIILDADAPGSRLSEFAVNIPLIARNGRHHGHLCLNPDKPLNETQATNLRLVAESLTQLMMLTPDKLVTEQLDKQKAFYENILNKLPTDIAVFDSEHRYLFVNPGAISKAEYRKFIIGKDDYEYAAWRNRDITVAHARRAKFLEAKNTGKEIRWEDSLPDANGNIITHLRRMFPVYDESGKLSLVIGFGIDITDRKLMEEKQAALVKQLSAQNTQLIDFCAIVSHNLRAPLVNISMLVDCLEETKDPGEHSLLITKLKPVIENLQLTFNELVESIQIRQDLEIMTEDVCLKECVRRTVTGLQTEINRLDAQITTDFSEASMINYAPQYLNSIFHNLVSNSLKYHHPARKPEIHLRTTRRDDKIILSIQDNGLGIDLVKHRNNFFKIGKVFHRHPNAKGFGLFMTKTQVEAMGGRIWVESTPQVGSTFYIEFATRNRQAS
ncbi:MAG TPA: ATP-binding protein [Puia sp.]|jgi:PAS domain S-box-containing protein|nr:ATP-binding protein [Puia sp.]